MNIILGILNHYNIEVIEVQTLGFESYPVKMASRMSETEIVKNFNCFPKEYAIICSNLEYIGKSHFIELIKGSERIESADNNAKVQRAYNILFDAVKHNIDLNLFIEEHFSVKKT